MEIEIALADLETVETQIDKRRKAAKQDRTIADEVEALGRALEILSEGTPLYRSELDDDSRLLLRNYFLLTNKPVLAIVNVGEDDLERVDELIAPVEAELGAHGEVIGMCVQLEAEAAQLDAEERTEMLEGLGLGRGGPAPIPDRRLPHARAAHLLHDRGEGVPGLDLPGRVQGAAVRRGHPHRLRAGLHPGRGDPLGRAARASGPGPRPGTRGSCASRARTTW